MHIEVRPAAKGLQFKWAFVATNGKQTANNELFPTRGHAIRAAKAVVRSVAKKLIGPAILGVSMIHFTQQRDGDVTRIDFS